MGLVLGLVLGLSAVSVSSLQLPLDYTFDGNLRSATHHLVHDGLFR